MLFIHKLPLHIVLFIQTCLGKYLSHITWHVDQCELVSKSRLQKKNC